MLPGIKQFDLTDKTAVITGGSKGLGQAMAAGLASAGADIMIVSRNLEESQVAAKQIAKDFGHNALAHQCDVSNPDDAETLAAAAVKQLGRVDILINNAGINTRGAIDELTYEQFREVQDINVDGIWLCCRAILPHMKERGSIAKSHRH